VQTRIAIALAAATLTSCATLVSKQQPIALTSDPAGATFTTSEGVTGRTPTAYQPLAPNKPLRVVFTLDGYEQAEATVEPHISGWIFGNIIFGGLLGLVIDAANPETRVLDSDPIHVVLQPVQG